MALTRVTPNIIAVANNVTNKTVGNTTSIPSFTFDGAGVVTAASNVAISGAGITANTVANSAFQTGSVENYMRGAGLGFGMRNRIINGAMVIDQRNAGASVTPTNGQYTLDRFAISIGGGETGKLSIQQNAGSVTPPAGFTNYLGVTSLSAYTVPTANWFTLLHQIEGLNVGDLAWGTANAKTITLSFWVRSSLTGTFGGALNNSGNSRNYPYSYTISAANTWEYKTVTIAGDTTGTWLTTNGIGIQVGFALGAGTTESGTAGAWTATRAFSATGATSVVGTNGATFYITGVQLEVGSTATSFDYRPYGTELLLCQRYFQIFVNNTGIANSTTGFRVPAPLQAPMRATPTVSSTGVLEISYPGSAQYTQSSAGVSIDTGNANGVIVQCDNFSGLTAQRVYFFLRANNNNTILLSSEL